MLYKQIKVWIIRNKVTGEIHREFRHKSDSKVKIYQTIGPAKGAITYAKKYPYDKDFWKDAVVVECILGIPPLGPGF